MRFRMFVVPALLLVVALPAQASAGGFSGVVVAKQPQRGTLLLAGAHGVGVTVRGGLAGTAVGRRVSVQGVRLDDGTIRMSRLHVLARVHSATLRGTVVRKLAGGTLLASGRTVVMIHHLGRRLASVSDHGGLQAGDVAEFRVRFDDDELVEERPPVQVGQASIVRIEGAVVSVSPLVVSVEGLPVTITLPVGVTLPAALAPGRRIELAVQIGTANTFTLVAIDEIQNENPVAQAQEVEVEGFASKLDHDADRRQRQRDDVHLRRPDRDDAARASDRDTRRGAWRAAGRHGHAHSAPRRGRPRQRLRRERWWRQQRQRLRRRDDGHNGPVDE